MSATTEGLQPQPPAAGRAGIGIANAQARLQHLYGAAASIALRRGEDAGATARIVLPFRELP